MEIEQVIELMKAMDASEITSLEFSQGNDRICLKKEKEVCYTQAQAVPQVVHTVQAPQPETEKSEENTDYITSPMIGTFYVAPSEGAEPFVQVGDHVKKGQVIGIVEAMKLMNEIEAETEGVVTEIMIENEQLVEYGQKLIKIKL